MRGPRIAQAVGLEPPSSGERRSKAPCRSSRSDPRRSRRCCAPGLLHPRVERLGRRTRRVPMNIRCSKRCCEAGMIRRAPSASRRRTRCSARSAGRSDPRAQDDDHAVRERRLRERDLDVGLRRPDARRRRPRSRARKPRTWREAERWEEATKRLAWTCVGPRHNARASFMAFDAPWEVPRGAGPRPFGAFHDSMRRCQDDGGSQFSPRRSGDSG